MLGSAGRAGSGAAIARKFAGEGFTVFVARRTRSSHEVPSAPVLRRGEIIGNEQVRARELIAEFDHPDISRVRQPVPPPASIGRRQACKGRHRASASTPHPSWGNSGSTHPRLIAWWLTEPFGSLPVGRRDPKRGNA